MTSGPFVLSYMLQVRMNVFFVHLNNNYKYKQTSFASNTQKLLKIYYRLFLLTLVLLSLIIFHHLALFQSFVQELDLSALQLVQIANPLELFL